jgi:hypothetical protein
MKYKLETYPTIGQNATTIRKANACVNLSNEQSRPKEKYSHYCVIITIFIAYPKQVKKQGTFDSLIGKITNSQVAQEKMNIFATCLTNTECGVIANIN